MVFDLALTSVVQQTWVETLLESHHTASFEPWPGGRRIDQNPSNARNLCSTCRQAVCQGGKAPSGRQDNRYPAFRTCASQPPVACHFRKH